MDFKAGLEWRRQSMSAKSNMKGGLKMNDSEHKYEDLDRMWEKIMIA